MHSSRDLQDREGFATYRLIYVSPSLIRTVASQVAGKTSSLPFFPEPIIFDESMVERMLAFHKNFERGASRLEQDSLLMRFLTQILLRYGKTGISLRSIGKERQAVRRVREFLQENYTENVSLNHLAQIAGLSPFHLNRVFRAEVGIPPHAYQIQARIDRAKSLLVRGLPPGVVALETGFADQSHLNRHFKRLVGLTTGRYAKNTQERSSLMNSISVNS
jgi:AraC-like DNA-binding protein